jgi:hypothetical protein
LSRVLEGGDGTPVTQRADVAGIDQEIFWGGGCCGEVLADGEACTPATNTIAVLL